MPDSSIRIGARALTASRFCIEEMRARMEAVSTPEKADLAYRASMMVRQAMRDQQLEVPLRGDFEDAIAILLVLGVTVVDV